MSGELKQEEKLLEDVEKKDIWQGADLEIIQLVSSMQILSWKERNRDDRYFRATRRKDFQGLNNVVEFL